MSDLMSEERRENIKEHGRYNEPKDKVISAILKKTDNGSKAKDVNIERNIKIGSKTLSKSSAFKSNVSNCSARNNGPYIRERSNTVGNGKELQSCLKKKPNDHSVSLEDVNLPFMYRKPILSASFYEAIERGHENKSRRPSNVSSASSQLGSISERLQNDVGTLNAETKTKTRSSGTGQQLTELNSSELQRQNKTESLLNDDAFVEESLDNFYRKNVQEINAAEEYSFLPETNTFKPISTSSMDNKRSCSQSQKLLAISFDAGSHSSAIELARNTLYVSGVNEVSGNSSNHNMNMINSAQMNERLSDAMFIEVNEDVLASRKRHGSSINVVPNSPRLCIKQGN